MTYRGVVAVVIGLCLSEQSGFAFSRCKKSENTTPDQATTVTQDQSETFQLSAAADVRQLFQPLKKLDQIQGRLAALSPIAPCPISNSVKPKSFIVQEIRDFLADFYRNLDPADENMEAKFNSFLKNIEATLPELKIFDYFHDFDRNVIDLKGLDILIEHFSQKSTFRNKLGVIKTVDGRDLTSFLNNLADQSFKGEIRLLVKHPGDRHISPILIRTDESETTVIIPDSLDWNNRHNFVVSLQTLINASQMKNVKIYSFATRRQGDVMSCPIISLRDLLESSRVDLFQYVEQTSSAGKTTLIKDQKNMNNLYIIDSLPPRFMKVTQTLEVIEQYSHTYYEWANEGVSNALKHDQTRRNSSARALQEVARDNTVRFNKRGQLVDVNFYARRKFFKYSSIIINQLLDRLNLPDPRN